jgi:predicted DNA-binding transcriptional regulator YafY
MGTTKRRSAHVLLHPVRLAIVQQLEIGSRRLTVAQLAAELPEISPATLYRHVNALVEARICVVAERRKVRSVEERVYAIRSAQSTLIGAERSARDVASPEQFDAIAMFLATLNADFKASRRSRRPRGRGVTYMASVAHLTEEDEAEIARIRAWVLALRSRPVPPNASLRLVTFMEFPYARPLA